MALFESIASVLDHHCHSTPKLLVLNNAPKPPDPYTNLTSPTVKSEIVLNRSTLGVVNSPISVGTLLVYADVIELSLLHNVNKLFFNTDSYLDQITLNFGSLILVALAISPQRTPRFGVGDLSEPRPILLIKSSFQRNVKGDQHTTVFQFQIWDTRLSWKGQARETNIKSQKSVPHGFSHVFNQPAQHFCVIYGPSHTTTGSHFNYSLCHFMNTPTRIYVSAGMTTAFRLVTGGLMGIKVWNGNTYWSRGLMISSVHPVNLKWRYLRKSATEMKGHPHNGSWGLLATSIGVVNISSAHDLIIDLYFSKTYEMGVEYNIVNSSVVPFFFTGDAMEGCLINYYVIWLKIYKHQIQMKQRQTRIGIYEEIQLGCTFGIKSDMWVFKGSLVKLINAIQMQNHIGHKRCRIKGSDDTQPTLNAKVLQWIQCLIAKLDKVFKNQSPLRQCQNCHTQQRIDYEMNMSKSQH
ncbi:hypothetical protein HanRHA438_Chr14g0667251 [Helianthus annuus]|nr:hypothetical protein HanRHA438_Chr14g0667251 [Helianthus annuus]